VEPTRREPGGKIGALGRFAAAVRGGGSPGRAVSGRSRPSRRPGARRSTASSSTERRFNRRSGGRFTGRAAILALVVSVLVLTLAYPLQEYLAQRSQIEAAERAQSAQQDRIAALEERKRKWADPAYVRVQARKRLQLVEPGVTVYVIEYGRPTDASQPGAGQPAGKASSQAPWYSQLWSSVQSADRGGTPAENPGDKSGK
jgi:cell division protein FtsB